MLKKILDNQKNKKYLSYILLFFMVIFFIIFFIRNIKLNDFFMSMEDKTFDLRQNILAKSKYKKVSKDIVIVTIDDASYEYLLGKYGEWPIPRNIYAQFINYVEKQDPKVIAFDLMFVESMKSKTNADNAIAEAITKNKNVYTAMNFDNQLSDIRFPPKLPNGIKAKVKNDSDVDFSKSLTFTNCRTILPQILNKTSNIGLINIIRANDGILRKLPPLMVYNNEFYPSLALLVGLKYLDIDTNNKSFYIDKNSNLELGNHDIPLDKDGGAILNWYGPAGQSFQEIPFYKIIKAMNGDKRYENFDFKNKIVYIGTTAVSLYDAKSVPVDKLYPGVEVHATYINNLIDNNFIKKTGTYLNLSIGVILAIFIGFIVFKARSTFIALGASVLIIVGYIILTYYLMKYFNLWVAIVLPVALMLFIFVSTYIIKYVLKSRDFDHQYKLATTDGLTDLYNHRYFQEQMLLQIENSKRYNTQFSLILLDIDFFKKFNDVYGHQSGDAVLRQVSQKIKKNIRSTDVPCRYGGEEMTIILPNAEKEEAMITAQKLCDTIAEKPFKLVNDKESNVTISLGVSTYPEDGQTSTELIEHADKLLYVAKESGRNQVGKMMENEEGSED